MTNSDKQLKREVINDFDKQFWLTRQENIKKWGESHIWLKKRGETAFIGRVQNDKK